MINNKNNAITKHIYHDILIGLYGTEFLENFWSKIDTDLFITEFIWEDLDD